LQDVLQKQRILFNRCQFLAIFAVFTKRNQTHTQRYTVTACYEQSQREPRKELNEGGDLREISS